MAIIHEGHLIKELTTFELSKQIKKTIYVQTLDNPKAIQHLRIHNYMPEMTDGNEIAISNPEAFEYPEHISTLLTEIGLPPRQIYLYTEDLEKYFLRTLNENKK